MPFCQSCGAKHEDGARFCPACGKPIGTAPVAAAALHVTRSVEAEEAERILWQGKPFLKKVASGIHYKLTNERLIITGGLLGRKEDQIDLARVRDIRVTQGVSDRATGVAQIEITSSDASAPHLRMMGVKNAREVKELIRNAANERRRKLGVTQRELM